MADRGLSIIDILDLAGVLRYGVPTSEKERLAVSRELPGAPADVSPEQGAAHRYASGYLFAQQHPTIAPIVQPLVDRLKVSDLPLFGGSSPELQAYASQGVTRALSEQANRMRTLGDLLR